MKKQVSKITALCKNHSKGCGWKGTLVEWEKHTEQCDYGTTACPDCEEVVPKNKVCVGVWVCTCLPVYVCVA